MPTEKVNQQEPATHRLLARVVPQHFVGRDKQITNIATLDAREASLLLLAAPAAGTTELLRQAYDKLFWQRGGASPIYFALTRADSTAVAATQRFLRTFLVQLIAHRRNNPSLIAATPTLPELMDLSGPTDYEWVEKLVRSYERARVVGDERALVQLCLGAPQQAALRGARSIVMLDDVHLADKLKGEVALGTEIAQTFTQARVPFVLAGLRRHLFDVLTGMTERGNPRHNTNGRLDRVETFHLERLPDEDMGVIVEHLAETFQVPLNDETRDLIVQQCAGNVQFTTSLIRAARRNNAALTSFRDCQKIYVDELMGGRINRRFNSIMEDIAPSVVTRRALLRVLHEAASNASGKSLVEAWRKRLNVEADDLYLIVNELHIRELASFNATFVEIGTDIVWRDYLRANYRLYIAAEPRAQVVAQTLLDALKRAPQTIERYYRREAALRVRDLLLRFNFQRVPASLLHNNRFNRMYHDITPDEVSAGLDVETDLIRLPQVVNAASCASFHPPMQLVCDEEQCIVAHGFEALPYTDANEVVWLTAELDFKLEAGRALTEMWYDRLTQLAQACGFNRARLWLIAPAGFSTEAGELLDERGAFGSSHQQLKVLAARLSPDSAAAQKPTALDEFEMVIPMGSDTELIAAATVEQIARRLDFHPEAINQIKTALIEACINATEHSYSPDRKIYQRFRVESDKLTVTVSSKGAAMMPGVVQNVGASLKQNSGDGSDSSKGRRGWRLDLIRTLMDEVEFESVDGGTRLRMTKYLRR